MMATNGKEIQAVDGYNIWRKTAAAEELTAWLDGKLMVPPHPTNS